MDNRLIQVKMEFKYDVHVHTSEVSACAVSSAKEQVKCYKEKGYTGIIITDHFINGNSTCPIFLSWEKKMKYIMRGFIEARKAGIQYELDVFFGWEYTVRGTDFLTYGLNLDFLLSNSDLADLTVEQYSKRVRDNGGFLAQAHPYRDEFYIRNPYPVEPHLIDAVEVFNASDEPDCYYKALEFARENNMPIQAGTDSHNINCKKYSGIILENKAESIFDIIYAIKNKKVKII